MGPKRKAVTAASSFFQPKKIAKEKLAPSSSPIITRHEELSLLPGLKWILDETLVRAVYIPTGSKTTDHSSVDSDVTKQEPGATQQKINGFSKHDDATELKPIAIAAFDLDSTLVTTKGRSPFPRDGSDWKWLYPSVRDHLRDSFGSKTGSSTHSSIIDASIDYLLVIISNQGGVVAENDKKRYIYLKDRIKSIVQDLETVPLRFYAATKPKKDTADKYRKPLPGMWDALKADLSSIHSIDLEKSFYVGDAAGRPKDFSDSDLKFAGAVGLRFFTPEQFFEVTN